MDRAIVTEIQKALASKGFSPGDIDGEYAQATALAVAHFQESQGLVVDGEVGRETATALGVSLTGVKPSEPAVKPSEPAVKPSEPAVKPSEPAVKPSEPIVKPFVPVALGAGTMNPLIAIAASVFPDIIKTIAGDRAGTVTGAVTKAVTEVTRTQNPEEASNKLAADPAAKAALQLKLAEIAAEQEEKRQQAQLAVLKAQYEDEAKRREAKLEELRAQIEDTKSARATFGALAQSNNPMA
ncbi:MAG TPA: peptidoglycan-binding domain-containing protein [Casimicrobiaceae bacterium]|nr:peptidoglycan-binding domain-containing protein [Casimicrobiaceae bacterium]